MKKNKTRRNKRQSFVSIYVSILLPMALITAILLYVVTVLFMTNKSEERKMLFSDSTKDLANSCDRNVDKLLEETGNQSELISQERYDSYITATNFNLRTRMLAGVIYADTNGDGVLEEIADSAPKVFIALRKNENGLVYFFEADPTVFDERVLEMLEEDSQNVNSETFIYINPEDVYIKGNLFYPGKYSVRKEDLARYDTTSSIEIGEYDASAGVPDEYEHVVIDGAEWSRVFTPIFIGNEDLSTLQALKSEAPRVAKDTTMSASEEMISLGKSITVMREEIDLIQPVTKTIERSDSTSADSGTQYKVQKAVIVTMMQLDLMKEYRMAIVIVYCVVGAIVALISAAIAYYYYRILKERFQKEQYRKDMTNALAHDLKSPLMVVSGYAENLKENVHGEKRDYYATSILETVNYMNTIIGNIMELAKFEDTKVQLQKEPIQLSEMTTELLGRYEELLKESGITCSIEGECSIKADKTLMLRVLDNVIGNSVKYTLQNGEIHVFMDKTSYRIENTGTIREEALCHIFEPFVKDDKDRSGESGSGLGLTIVKNILDLHGYKYQMNNASGKVRFEIHF